MMRTLETIVLLLLFIPMSVTSYAEIDSAQAAAYFREARTIALLDAGKLWGVSLNGPLMFVDPQTRQIIANEPDKEGKLEKRGDIFAGILPESESIANTAVTWAGVKWTMVVWPLPSDEIDRPRLLLHELFHRIQDEIGVPMTNPANAHLETMQGRLWLRLECRALKQALESKGRSRLQAASDALLFRRQRRSLFSGAASEENSLEMNEGLAEYTGVKLSGGDPAGMSMHRLENLEASDFFARSFAYATGPAYGILLDQKSLDWRKQITSSSDFSVQLQKAYGITLADSIDRTAAQRALFYGGKALQLQEGDREEMRRQRLAQYRSKFIDGPRLIIPLQQMQIQFDPSRVEPLEDLGTIYPVLRVSDNWGILTVEDGALVSKTWTELCVPAMKDPQSVPVQGSGWKLELKEGWTIVPAKRAGDYQLIKKD